MTSSADSGSGPDSDSDSDSGSGSSSDSDSGSGSSSGSDPGSGSSSVSSPGLGSGSGSNPIPKPGRAWAYESIIHAIPGYELSRPLALAVQFFLFESAILLLGIRYGLWEGVIFGTIGVVVAVVGSVGMLRISSRARQAGAPEAYLRLLFGSRIDLVLGVVAYALVITYLVAVDTGENALLTRLLGPDLPPAALFVLLVVLWDVCYRIGTAWWATVVALWRSLTLELAPQTRSALIRVDAETIALSAVQLLLLPFAVGSPVLAFALIGHLVAVVVVAGSSIVLLTRGGRR